MGGIMVEVNGSGHMIFILQVSGRSNRCSLSRSICPSVFVNCSPQPVMSSHSERSTDSSLNCHAEPQRSISGSRPGGAHIQPVWVARLDQGHLLRPSPAFNLLLAGKGSPDVRR